jgi:hypothetical protein
MVVVRKNISVRKARSFVRSHVYFFYITNDCPEADEIVFGANDRCHQENLPRSCSTVRRDGTGGQPGEQLGVHGHDALA